MKRVPWYWSILIFVFLIAAIFLYSETAELEQQLQHEQQTLIRLNNYYDQYKRHEDYIRSHVDMLGRVTIDEMKDAIRCIANMSAISEVKLKGVSEKDNLRCFSLTITTLCEQGCYRFIYFLERVFHGVVNIYDVKIEKQKSVYSMDIKINIHYFDTKFVVAKKIAIENKQMCVYALTNDMKRNCEFSIIKEQDRYQVNALIGNNVLINKKSYSVGQTIKGYKIRNIERSMIILESPNGNTKNVALGAFF